MKLIGRKFKLELGDGCGDGIPYTYNKEEGHNVLRVGNRAISFSKNSKIVKVFELPYEGWMLDNVNTVGKNVRGQEGVKAVLINNCDVCGKTRKIVVFYRNNVE